MERSWLCLAEQKKTYTKIRDFDSNSALDLQTPKAKEMSHNQVHHQIRCVPAARIDRSFFAICALATLVAWE